MIVVAPEPNTAAHDLRAGQIRDPGCSMEAHKQHWVTLLTDLQVFGGNWAKKDLSVSA